jgi:hypothetical protein
MDLTLEDLHHRLNQLRFLATQTDDPLAERLVRDLIVELEDRLTAESLSEPSSPSLHARTGYLEGEQDLWKPST